MRNDRIHTKYMTIYGTPKQPKLIKMPTQLNTCIVDFDILVMENVKTLLGGQTNVSTTF